MNTQTTPKNRTLPPNGNESSEAALAKLLKELTDREIELLCHLTDYPTNEEVADKMCISSKSIANYKNRIGEKLNLKGHRVLIKFVLKHFAFFKSIASVFVISAQRVEKQQTVFVKKDEIGVKIPHKLGYFHPNNSCFEPLYLWCYNK
jgi:DNA-binding CsgD family transcriptional regulator